MRRNLSVLAASVVLAVCPVAAQTTTATVSPAKKELVARILKLQQPGIEAMARNMAEQPAAMMLERAGAALPQRVAAEKRDAVANEIKADVKKYSDDVVPMVQARAIKLAPGTIGVQLEEKFTEDELKQIIAVMESAAFAKFQQLGVGMQNALMEKLIAETRASVEPKVLALDQAIAKRLGVPAPASGAGPRAGSTPPAAAASK